MIIDSLSRFVQGKIIQNKKVDTRIQVVIDTWIMCFEIPSHDIGSWSTYKFSWKDLAADVLG